MPRARNATVEEIQRSLRDAGDHLGEMIKFEAEAAAATTGLSQDLEACSEANRKFAREFRAFLGATTTAWNYMIQGSNATGTRPWLEQRLSSNLCKFHRELENQAAHDYRIEPGVRQRVTYVSDAITPMHQTSFGPLPVEMKVTGFKGVSYHHNPRNLEPDVVPLCESVQRRYPNETIVELAALYHDDLQRTFRAGEQRGKFGDSERPASPVAPLLLDAKTSID